MSNDDPTIVSKEGYLQVKIHGQPKWHRRYCIIDWDKSILFAASKTDRRYGDWIILLPKVQIIDSELPADFTIEISSDNETHALLPESKKEHDAWLIALKRTAYSRVGGAIFGQSLEETQKYSLDKSSIVPVIVRQCCEFLLEYGTDFVGLFRIPGKQSSIKEYRDKYDRGASVEFDPTCSPATVSSLLKIYLQSLPEPIIPMKNFDSFLEIGSRFKYQRTSDLDPLKNLIETTLPRINYSLLAYLCVFLKKLTEYAHETKMDTENFAITFGSNLIRASEELDMNMIKGHNYNLFPLIKALIDHSDYLFTRSLTESREHLSESCEHQHETITKSSGFSSFSSLLSSNDHQVMVRTRSSSLPSIPYATSSSNDRVEYHSTNSTSKNRSKSVMEKPIMNFSSFEPNSHVSSMTYIQGEYTVNEEKDEDIVQRRLTSSDRLDRDEFTNEQACTKSHKRKSAIPWQFSSKSNTSSTLPRKGSKKTFADKFAKPFTNIKHSMSKAFIPPITSSDNLYQSATLDASFRSMNRADIRRTSDFTALNDSYKLLENQVNDLKQLVEEKDSMIKNLKKTSDDDRRRYEKENSSLRQMIEQLQYENSQLKAIYQPDN